MPDILKAPDAFFVPPEGLNSVLVKKTLAGMIADEDWQTCVADGEPVYRMGLCVDCYLRVQNQITFNRLEVKP